MWLTCLMALRAPHIGVRDMQSACPYIHLRTAAAQGHALRAAINTPIQGSAADVATAAMLAISRNERLRAMGWTMLLQARPCADQPICSCLVPPPEGLQQMRVVRHVPNECLDAAAGCVLNVSWVSALVCGRPVHTRLC